MTSRALGFVLVVVVVVTAVMAFRWRDISDFEYHNAKAELIVEQPLAVMQEVPNFLYHVLAGVPPLPNVSVGFRGALVMTASTVFSAWLLFAQLVRVLPERSRHAELLVAGFVLAFTLAAPVNLFTPQNLYYGYFPTTVYHNPTTILMKPFALGAFFMLPRLYDAGFRSARPYAWLVGYGLMTVLGMLAKPSFIMVALPALAVVTLYRLWKHAYVHWLLLIGGVVLPALLLLVYQTLVLTSPELGGGIYIEPLRTHFEWTLHYDKQADQQLLEKLLLSIAFPVLVFVLYWRESRKDMLFLLAWVMLGFGLLYSYLLVDRIEIAAGNFIWSAQIAVVLLFAAAMRLLASQPLAAWGWRGGTSLAVLGLHLLAGFYWYYLHLTVSYENLIWGLW